MCLQYNAQFVPLFHPLRHSCYIFLVLPFLSCINATILNKSAVHDLHPIQEVLCPLSSKAESKSIEVEGVNGVKHS